MSDKLKIVYVGNKAAKRDTITGSRLLFKRGEALAVETAIARRLLEYPKIWVEEHEAEEFMEVAKAAEEKRIQEAEQKAIDDAKQLQLESMITLDAAGEPLDLAKYTGPQLQTLVEAEELDVEAKPKPVADYRVAVRDAMRTKHGEPELEQE